MQILTQWYPRTINPVRDGNYLCIIEGADSPMLLEWWDDEWFEWWPRNSAPPRVKSWRGLAFNPGAAVEHKTLYPDYANPSKDGYGVIVKAGWWVPQP